MPEPPESPLERVAMLLDRAVRRLGDAGEPDAAARLAAEAWWLLKEPAPVCARRLNATLHYLTLGKPSKSVNDEPERGEIHVHQR